MHIRYNTTDKILEYLTPPSTWSPLEFAGIKFLATQVASSNPNTLDDYETDGLWTPSFGGSGGQSGQTYAFRAGTYTKVGDLVFAAFYIVLSAKGAITGGLQIQGLPFVAKNVVTNRGAISITFFNTLLNNTVWIYGAGVENASFITINTAPGPDIVPYNMVSGDITDSTTIAGSITYIAA